MKIEQRQAERQKHDDPAIKKRGDQRGGRRVAFVLPTHLPEKNLSVDRDAHLRSRRFVRALIIAARLLTVQVPNVANS